MAEEPRSVRRTLSPRQAFMVILFGVVLVAVLALPYTSLWRETAYRSMTLSELQRCYPDHGGDPILLYWLGQRLNEKGQYREAAPILEAAVTMDPNEARSRDAWAQAQLATGQAGPAFSQLKQFTMTHPQDAKAHLLLGKLHVTLGADVLAEPELKDAIRLTPALPDAWNLLGDVYYRGARENEAQSALRQAIFLQPNRASAYATLGKLLRKRDTNGAAGAFRRSVELEPDNAIYHSEYAGFLHQYGHSVEAEQEARAALRLDANDAQANLILGRCLRERNSVSEAQTVLEKAATLEPFDPLSARELQLLFKQQGNRLQATIWAKHYTERLTVATEGRRLNDVLLKAPHDRQAHYQMARYQAKLGKIEECIHHFAIAFAAPLDSPDVMKATIHELHATGHDDAARAIEQQMLPRTP